MPSIHTRDERSILLLRFSSISREMKDQNTFTLRGWRDGSVGKVFATKAFKLNFEPQHPQKKPAVAMLACNSSAWEGRNKQEGLWGSRGCQSSSRVSERSNTKGGEQFWKMLSLRPPTHAACAPHTPAQTHMNTCALTKEKNNFTLVFLLLLISTLILNVQSEFYKC